MAKDIKISQEIIHNLYLIQEFIGDIYDGK
jgi:hypothetical protein